MEHQSMIPLKYLSSCLWALTHLSQSMFTCAGSQVAIIVINIIYNFSLKIRLPENAIHLMKTLNERNFMVAIHQNLINNTLPTHQHSNFIVLDFACENIKQLMKQVIITKKRIVSGNCFRLSRIWRDVERVIPPCDCRKLKIGDPTYALIFIVGLTGYLALEK